MKLIVIVWEGECEERFCHELLCAHLAPRAAVLTQRAKASNNHTFAANLDRLLDPLAGICRRHPAALVTTMIDFARLKGLPPDIHRHPHAAAKKRIAEKHLTDQLALRLGDRFRPDRWLPYIQMHDFEALLLADPSKIAELLNRDPDSITGWAKRFATPEDINGDNPPARRLAAIHPRYPRVKATLAIPAARAIGLAAMRRACPLFDAWISELERYAAAP